MISTLASRISQRAMMNFCWLPPDRLVIGSFSELNLAFICSARRATSAIMSRLRRCRRPEKRSMVGRAVFSAMESRGKMPSCLRSSGR